MGAALLAIALAANPALDAAAAHLRALRYEEALPLLVAATSAPAESAAERRQAFGLLAHARAAVGDLSGAVEAYEALLTVDPHAPPPRDAAPKLRRAFAQARQRAQLGALETPTGRGAVTPSGGVGSAAGVAPTRGAAASVSRSKPEVPRAAGDSGSTEAPGRPELPTHRPSLAPPMVGADPPVASELAGALRRDVSPAPPPVARAVAMWSGTVAVVAAASGVGFGLAAQSDARAVDRATSGGQSRLLHRELEALVQRQHLEAGVANGAFAVAVAAAATAAVAAWLGANAVPTPPSVTSRAAP